jgi:MYXO-CTERM domain-containing protein
MVMLRHLSRVGHDAARAPRSPVVLCALAGGVVVFAAAPANAEPAAPSPAMTTSMTIDGLPGHREARDTPLESYATPFAKVSPTIYLERCKGGCRITVGNNDARTNMSSIPMKSGSVTVGEFATADGKIGGDADDEWTQIVQCMKEVYSPYAVTVTDVKPTTGQSFHEAVIAGIPNELGLDSRILGIAPLAGDCSAIDNVISFTLANAHTGTDTTDRVYNICWTAAQESAHAFGLDHEYTFAGGRSACNDPMTYRVDCGGQKFFRNEVANCGENEDRPCKCGGTQNSHLKLLSVFGAGTPSTGVPTVALAEPAAGATVLGPGVAVTAGAKRGVARIELFFNGFKWNEKDGAPFQKQGQPNPSSYSLLVPATLPNSIVDVKAIAYDDLGASSESPVITVTRGAPCTSASACATGQKCEAGKCFWDPAVGEIGDSCAYPQFCKTNICIGTATQLICSQNCVPNTDDSCPSGMSCVAQSANQGVCFFDDTGGCCSTSDGTAWWVHGGIAALVLGLATRRRRR